MTRNPQITTTDVSPSSTRQDNDTSETVDCIEKEISMTPNLAEVVTQSKLACNIPKTSTEKFALKDRQDMQ